MTSRPAVAAPTEQLVALATLLREGMDEPGDGTVIRDAGWFAGWLLARGVSVWAVLEAPPSGSAHFPDGTEPSAYGVRGEAPPEQRQRGDPPKGDLRTDVRRFVEYVADVQAGRVKRLDRDVVLSLSANMERHL